MTQKRSESIDRCGCLCHTQRDAAALGECRYCTGNDEVPGCNYHKAPRIVAECWTCGSRAHEHAPIDRGSSLDAEHATMHRAAGHDVRPVKG